MSDAPRTSIISRLFAPPWRPAALLVLLLLQSALLYGVHRFSTARAAPELAETRERLAQLRAEVNQLGKRMESTRARLASAEQEAEVMRQANQLLRTGESRRQEELQRLQAELDFYRRLAGSSATQDGLAVYELELQPTGSGQVFRFVLTLTQNLQRSAITTGIVRLELEGTLADQLTTLAWPQLSREGSLEPAFRFKYFQQLDGYLVVPAGFAPARLVVNLDVKGQPQPIVRAFDWAELIRSAAAGPPPVRDPSPPAGAGAGD